MPQKSNAMNILVLTNFYPPYSLGGYEMLCRDIVDGLLQRHHRVVVLTSRLMVSQGEVDGHVYRQLYFVRGYHRLKQRSVQDGMLGTRYYQLKFALISRINYATTRMVLQEMQPDLVYAWNMYDISIGPLLAAHDYDIPLVFNLGDYWLAELKQQTSLHPNHLKRWYRAVMTGLHDFQQLDCRHINCVSHALKARYGKFGFQEQHITVISPGIERAFMLKSDALGARTRPDQRTMKLVFVGRVVQEKGVNIALEAVRYLVADNKTTHVQFDIIGGSSDDYLAELHDIVAKYNLQNYVNFLGKRDHQEVVDLYTDYDALLFPSLWVEPFGVTILEAMARGLPVIATNHGGPTEILTDGETGLLVPPGDAVALAHAVQRLAHDQALADTIRRKALQTIRERYTLDHIIDQHEAYLQQVIEQTRSGSHVRSDEKIS